MLVSKLKYFVLCCIVVGSLPGTFAKRHGKLPHKRSRQNGQPTQIQKSSREPKLFPFLSFVTLPPSTCMAESGTIGACMTSKKCRQAGGTSSGSCVGSFGVCCLVTQQCSGNGKIDKVTVNGTRLVQSSMGAGLCRYEIPRPDGVCQVRLDFNDFSIEDGMDASTFGNCATDTFQVSGAANGIVGPLCGDLKGQHMYLDYGNSDKISLDMFIQTQMSQKWDISVTTIRCDSLNRAPAGCLQYFQDQTGMVKSFNYNNMIQLNNQDYTVCVKAQVGMRKITWKPCGTNPSTLTDFVISGGPPASNPGGNAVGIPASGDNCSLDWVMVLGQNKYCGSQFPDSVSTTSQPFILQVHFNEYELPPPPPCNVPEPYACPGALFDVPGQPQPDAMNTGFCLKYSQVPY